MFVPVELVSEIIRHILDAPARNDSPELPGFTTKPAWGLLDSLSLASKTYRSLALEAWFRCLFIKSPTDITAFLRYFPELKCSRVVHCVQEDTSKVAVWDLQGLDRVVSIRLDWLSRSMMPFYYSDIQTGDEKFPFVNASSNVAELDIRGLRWPSPMAFHFIGQSLPTLKVLKIRQNRIWCGLCHTCSIVRFREPGPEKIVYTEGEGLPMHYARALLSLGQLEMIHITIPDYGSGKTQIANNPKLNENIWAGECDRCMEVMYEDNAFREKWVAKKRGIVVGEKNEMVYVRPPSLKRVEWHFFKGQDSEAEDKAYETDIESDSEVSDVD